MQTVDKPSTAAVLSALLGLALVGGIGLAPAAAQDNTTSNHEMMTNRPILNPWDMIDPMPLSYPWAAPASLHQYHWRDYTQTIWEPGSVSDARYEQMHQMEKNWRDRGALATEDREMRDPMPFSYPWASPASLHQYHWTDYTKTVWEPGSVEDARYEQMVRAHERMRERGVTITEDPDYIDPMPFSYPWAAPATLHQYHWRDYTQTVWEPGSVADERYEKMMRRQRKEWNDMRRDEQMSNMGGSGNMNK
jgi:hypothetical protein